MAARRNDGFDDVLPEAVLDELSVLAGRERKVSEISGGLTNRNFKVVVSDGAYVVRVSSKESLELAINREHEYQNSVRAANAGVGAKVVGFLPEHSMMAVEFLEGETFTDTNFQIPGTIVRVAEAVKQLHRAQAFVSEFNMFDIQAGYLNKVLNCGYRLPGDYLNYQVQLSRIKDALSVNADSLVPCNNDLLAGNFIDTGEEIRLIDYEYAGNNDACFELGNIWSECHLTESQLEELVTAYYGQYRANRVARARLQAFMSQYGWTLWASIQDATSSLDFDFWEWGMEKYDRAVALLRSRDFEKLLETVQTNS
jgi:hypothetical protein